MALKILTACGQGLGSCQIIKMKLKKVLTNLKINADITSTNVSMGKSTANSYDVIFCGQNLVDSFKSATSSGALVIGLKNLMSEQEIEEKLRAAIDNGTLKVP